MNVHSKRLSVCLIVLILVSSLLAGCTSTRGVEAQVQDLYSDDPSVQRTAVEQLADMGEEAVIPLINVFYSGENGPSIWAAVALCQIGEPSVYPLIEELSNDDEVVRGWAINTLACIGEPAILPLLGELEMNDITRDSAILALVKIGRPVIPYLKEMLNSDSEGERMTAAAIIQSIYLTEQLQQETLNLTGNISD